MPMTPQSLEQAVKAITWTYLDQPGQMMRYRPALLSEEKRKRTVQPILDKLSEAQETENRALADMATLEMAAWVCTWLVWWDFYEADGATMQPITPENVAALFDAYTDYMQAMVQAAMQGGDAAGKPSATGYSELPVASSPQTAMSTSTPPLALRDHQRSNKSSSPRNGLEVAARR